MNPNVFTSGAKVQVMTVPFTGGQPRVIDEGDNPIISPDSRTFAFIKNDEVWMAPVDGKSKARKNVLCHVEIVIQSVGRPIANNYYLFLQERIIHS